MSRERILLIFVLIFFFGSLVAASFLVFKGPEKREVKIPTDIKDLTMHRGNLAVIYIYGPIQIEPPRIASIFPRGTDYLVQKIKHLRENPDVKVVVVRINSPGGTVGAVQEVYHELLKLKKSGKKLVASLGEVAASGGYYIACAADKIVANPGTITGSIGVLIPITNFEGLFKKLGINVQVIKSKKHKDIGTSSRPLTPEEEKILKSMVDNAYQQFLSAVKAGRGNLMSEKQIEEAADGRIMTGEQAKEINLIDELGNFEDAINTAAKLAGIEGKVRILEEKRGFRRIFWQLGARVSHPLQRLLPPKNGVLEYRWSPEY
ncbi:MAG TPA: signal peptide peptidase SppA [Candidatus Omnitrophica bacterium]|nr:signal peptide peptidase SppA [Candidatus Omnitrophota bacterium]